MKCLDTDLLVAILRGKDKDAEEKMKQLDQEGRHGTTTLNAFELFYGAYRSESRAKNLDKMKALMGRLDILPLDYNSSDKAGELLADLADDGKTIDFRDALIAGISITNNLSLVTRNKEHFSRIKGLKLEQW
ncbi:MAG: type II toxin-antitoxin system VapC family toxin [archaeon]|nr:type II toxin-antitoxin system VapC family toxin [archaeon]